MVNEFHQYLKENEVYNIYMTSTNTKKQYIHAIVSLLYNNNQKINIKELCNMTCRKLGSIKENLEQELYYKKHKV